MEKPICIGRLKIMKFSNGELIIDGHIEPTTNLKKLMLLLGVGAAGVARQYLVQQGLANSKETAAITVLKIIKEQLYSNFK